MVSGTKNFRVCGYHAHILWKIPLKYALIRYIAVNNNCKRKKMSRRKRQKNGMINNENENKIDSAEPENNSMTQQTVDAQQMVIPQESERILT